MIDFNRISIYYKIYINNLDSNFIFLIIEICCKNNRLSNYKIYFCNIKMKFEIYIFCFCSICILIVFFDILYNCFKIDSRKFIFNNYIYNKFNIVNINSIDIDIFVDN